MTRLSLAALFVLSLAVSVADAQDTEFFDIRVLGDVHIGVDGTVLDIRMEQGTPDYLVGPVSRRVRQWRFHPIVENGEAIEVWVRMNLGLVGEANGDDVRIRVGGVEFNPGSEPVGYGFFESTRVPRFPNRPNREGVEGMVEVEFEVAPDGTVTETHVTRVALAGPKISPSLERRLIDDFSRASVSAIRKWKAKPADDVRRVRFTFDYRLARADESDANRWRGYRWIELEPAPWGSPKSDDAIDGLVATASAVRLVNDVTGQYL